MEDGGRMVVDRAGGCYYTRDKLRQNLLIVQDVAGVVWQLMQINLISGRQILRIPLTSTTTGLCNSRHKHTAIPVPKRQSR